MSGDPEQEYFADGMVEEIITGLSRIKWLFVIARNSSFVYKGKAVPTVRTRAGRALSEIERSRRKRPENLHAYDLYVRALPLALVMPADARIAAGFLEDASEAGPELRRRPCLHGRATRFASCAGKGKVSWPRSA